MMQGRALAVAFVLAVLPGCLGEGAGKSPSWLQRFRPFQGVTGPDAVHLDVAVIELPYADAGRYRDLWTFVDEGDRIIPLEKQGPLEENGFRVGQVSVNLPQEILELITNKRTCSGARRIQIVAGQEERCFDVGPVLPSLSFQLWQKGQSTAVELQQAQCGLNLAPSLIEGGRVRLAITPKVRHVSNTKTPWIPRSDRTGWMRNVQQPTEAYSSAGFEVTLASGEYLVIGPRPERLDTLGSRTFVRPNEAVPVQRLIVLRAHRPNAEETTQEMPRQGPVPLALQANRPSVRGVGP